MDAPEAERNIGILVYKSESPGIGGEIKQVPDDFLVEEIKDSGVVGFNQDTKGQAQTPGDFVHFTLEKKNWDTMRALKEISRRLGVSQRRFGFAGTKDKFAITRQRASVSGVSIEELSRVNIKDIALGDFTYADGAVQMGDLLGNRFTVTIRGIDCDPAERITAIAKELKNGFPNFFGIQRFGEIRPVTHLVGAEILMGDFEEAVMIYLTKVYGGESHPAKEARAQLCETRDFKGSAGSFQRMGYESAMINHLIEKPGDYQGALLSLPPTLTQMFVHAFQSYVFNLALSGYIGGGFAIERLPLVGYLTEPDEISAEILEKEGINKEMFRSRRREFNSKGNLRDCFVPVDDFEVLSVDKDEMNEGKLKTVLRFSLGKGSYATVFLSEVMKGQNPKGVSSRPQERRMSGNSR